MKKLKKSQSGFSALYAMLTVLAIAILGISGWFVYQNNKTKLTHAASNPNPSTSQSTSTTPSPSPTPTPTTATLDIKEWGIKLPLSDSIHDAYYTTAGSNIGDDGQPNTVWIGLASLNGSGCNISNTGPSATASPIGAIIRVLPTDRDPVSGELYTQQYPNGTTINGHYYAYKPWNKRTCASTSTLQSVDSAFATATKSTTITTVN